MKHSKSKKIVLSMLIAFAGLQGLQAETAKKGSIWSYCAINPESPIKDRQKFEELLRAPTLTLFGIINEFSKMDHARKGKNTESLLKDVSVEPLSKTFQERAKYCESGKYILSLSKNDQGALLLSAECFIANRDHSFERFAKKILVPVDPLVLEMEGYFGDVLRQKVMQRAQSDLISLQNVYTFAEKNRTYFRGVLLGINIFYAKKDAGAVKIIDRFTIDNLYYAYMYDFMIFASQKGKGTFSDLIALGAEEAVDDPSKIGTGANEKFRIPFLIFVPDFYVKTIRKEQADK
jgi:hypothetical protein